MSFLIYTFILFYVFKSLVYKQYIDLYFVVFVSVAKEEPKSAKEMEAALKQVDAGVRAKDKDLQTLKKNLQLEEQKLQKDIDKKRYVGVTQAYNYIYICHVYYIVMLIL